MQDSFSGSQTCRWERPDSSSLDDLEASCLSARPHPTLILSENLRLAMTPMCMRFSAAQLSFFTCITPLPTWTSFKHSSFLPPSLSFSWRPAKMWTQPKVSSNVNCPNLARPIILPWIPPVVANLARVQAQAGVCMPAKIKMCVSCPNLARPIILPWIPPVVANLARVLAAKVSELHDGECTVVLFHLI